MVVKMPRRISTDWMITVPMYPESLFVMSVIGIGCPGSNMTGLGSRASTITVRSIPLSDLLRNRLLKPPWPDEKMCLVCAHTWDLCDSGRGGSRGQNLRATECRRAWVNKECRSTFTLMKYLLSVLSWLLWTVWCFCRNYGTMEVEEFDRRGYLLCHDTHFAAEAVKKMEICVHPAVKWNEFGPWPQSPSIYRLAIQSALGKRASMLACFGLASLLYEILDILHVRTILRKHYWFLKHYSSRKSMKTF